MCSRRAIFFIHLAIWNVISHQLSDPFALTITIKLGGARSSRLVGMFVLWASFSLSHHSWAHSDQQPWVTWRLECGGCPDPLHSPLPLIIRHIALGGFHVGLSPLFIGQAISFPMSTSVDDLHQGDCIWWPRLFDLSRVIVLLPKYPTSIYTSWAASSPSIFDQGTRSDGWVSTSRVTTTQHYWMVVNNAEGVAPPRFCFTALGEGWPSLHFSIKALPYAFKAWYGKVVPCKTALRWPQGHNFSNSPLHGF